MVRDLRDARAVACPDELAAFETDVLAGFVLARAAAGLSDGTISSDVIRLEQVRAWLGRPLWDMEPSDADAYFGKMLRSTAKGTRLSRAPVDTAGIALPATGIGRTTPAGNARTRDAAAVSLLRAIQRQQEHERRKAAR